MKRYMNMGFRTVLCFLLCLTVLTAVTPLYQHVNAATNPRFVDGVNGLAGVLTPVDTSGGTDTTAAWKGYLRTKFYAALGSESAWTPKWKNTGISWKWSGVTASGTAATSTAKPSSADAIPFLDSTTYYVWSGEQLLYALTQCATTGGTVQIMDDIDLNGEDNVNWDAVPFKSTTAITTVIEGNNHTIYNLQSIDSKGIMGYTTYHAGLIGELAVNNDFTIRNLDFANMNMLAVVKDGTTYKCPNSDSTGEKPHCVGIVARAGAKNFAMENIHVTDSLLTGGSYVGSLFGRCDNGGGNTLDGQMHKIKNCSVQNTIAYGDYHVGSLGGSYTFSDDTSYSFSTGSTVVSIGGHSGGLFGCVTGIIKLHDCFVDAEVYGTKQTGVFAGTAGVAKLANGQIGGAVVNCFASGFVEGQTQLGGFVGIASNVSAFINCYTSALVGLRSQGTKLGGFMGDTLSGYNYTVFVNCYATGEVGSADIVSTDNTNTATNPIISNNNGGFVGYSMSNTRLLYASCYYDKQTTAMREWKAGIVNGQTIFNVTGSSYAGQFYSLINNASNVSELPVGAPGVQGVLTTDTDKDGTGLISNPGSSKGFKGFMERTDFPQSAQDIFFVRATSPTTVYMDLKWDYSAANHYPELDSFATADDARWGKYASVARDYSKSSTSTIQLETWEKSFDAEGGMLKADTGTVTAYDTVRDLTARFNCTGNVANYKWNRIATPTGTIGSDANANGATVTIAGKSGIPVGILSTKSMTLNGESGTFYYADEFAPGLEWLSVTYGQAERRLRFMPTVGIEAGASKTIYRPSEYAPNSLKDAAFYDHANDVEMFYSTAPRLDKNINDITTGIYPDASGTNEYSENHMSKTADKLTDRQKLLMSESSDSDISSYFTTNSTDNSYGLQTSPTLTHVGVDASFMSRDKDNKIGEFVEQSNSADGSKLYIYAREIESVGANGELKTGDSLMDFTDVANANTYNGLALGAHGDQILMLQYVWKLSDGRIVTDAKLITVRATPFYTEITGYEAGGTDAEVDTANKKADDNHNGLRDTDDLLLDFQKQPGGNNDSEIATFMDTFTPTNRTTDYLYPYTVDPKTDEEIPAEKVGPEYTDAAIASWKVTDKDKVVTKVIVRMDSGTNNEDGTKKYFTAEINPNAPSKTDSNGNPIIVVPYKYYRYVTSEDGTFYVQEESLEREYVLHKTSNGVYYLAFNKMISNDPDTKTDLGHPVDVIDTSNNIEVDVELSTSVEAQKKVTGDYGDANEIFDFTISLSDHIEKDVEYPYYITHLDGSVTSKNDGEALTVTGHSDVVKMKHGDKITIIHLPYGTSYSIAETDYTDIGYMTAVDNTAGNTATGSLTVDPLSTDNGNYSAERAHIFHNDRSAVPPTYAKIPSVTAYIFISLCCVGAIAYLIISSKKRNDNDE